MPDRSDAARVRATCARLVELLNTIPAYIATWSRHGDRKRNNLPNQRAVGKAINDHLFAIGETDDEASKIKNSVNRAFLGARLSPKLLETFVAAFDMTDEHARELRNLYNGVNSVQNTMHEPRAMAKKQWHRTVALFELWSLDAGGALDRRRVVQCVEAKVDGVDSYLFHHETEAARIDVLHGGQLGRRYEYGGGLVGHDIVFDQPPLRTGERAEIEYAVTYRPRFCPTEVRRPARGMTSNVSLGVRFDPGRLPDRVWFCVWRDHCDGDPTQEESVSIGPGNSVSRCLVGIEETVVGFRWEW